LCCNISVKKEFLLNCKIGCKKHIVGSAAYHGDLHKFLCNNVLRGNGGIDPKQTFSDLLTKYCRYTFSILKFKAKKFMFAFFSEQGIKGPDIMANFF